MNQMKKATIGFWIFTLLLAIPMVMASITDLIPIPEAVAGFKQLGYPVYLLPFLGVARILGVLALVVPGFSRLKEWAYAGFTFDLAGAVYSCIAINNPLNTWLPVCIGFVLIAGSYYFYHKRRALMLANTVSKQHVSSGMPAVN